MIRAILQFLLFATVVSGITAAHSTQLKFEDIAINFSLPEGWSLGEVTGIQRRENGNFIIFHRGQHQLLEFDENFQFVREIGHGLFKNPHGLRIDKMGNVWTTDTETHVVLKFSETGKVTMVLGKNGLSGTGWFDRDYNLTLFNQPMDVAFDRKGYIYVVDKGNDRIVKLDQNGFIETSWGQKGTGRSQFNFAHSIVIDSEDRVYVADRENQRIQIFDLEGTYLKQWKNVGYPYMITLSKDSLWMTDARAEQVKQFDMKGNLIRHHRGIPGRNTGQYSAVHGIFVDKKNQVWVTQIFNWAGVNLLKFTP
ncbi:peptidyl-alpha-hydroxyglycine alpha-amidating lyase family protein [Temperatibacter marinus]|uniref:Peptidyl-alpha-hydroxyglycine alpha-amidating lyase family protein n=1 Tax=Temperatibacter marinus TaxID=1456591 RepID=A0AA52ECM8_9PROT|nr:peptidyl-alpha-hydroxyglycine alpha-amidating lyase family protein [Temperatibacter marinus]WND02972.1 peptidyl-alpha-hydroxyglycine alpha-amidating lyase family protein [Temperatibacter marinus]